MKRTERIEERYVLATGRIREIQIEEVILPPYRDYFQKMAHFLCQMLEFSKNSADERQKNIMLYQTIVSDQYEMSYANPRYAMKLLGDRIGQLLSFVYTELRAAVRDLHQKKTEQFLISCELFLELYAAFEEGIPLYRELKEIVYWYISDYSDVFYLESLKEGLRTGQSWIQNFIREEKWHLSQNLYQYGLFLSEREFQIAEHFNHLSEQAFQLFFQANIWEQLRDDEEWSEFYKQKRDGKERWVRISYRIGMERLAKELDKNLKALGYHTVFVEESRHRVTDRGCFRGGCFSAEENPQYRADHREDDALYLNRAFCERRKQLLRQFLEKQANHTEDYLFREIILDRKEEKEYLVMEKPERISYSDKQKILQKKDEAQRQQIVFEYFPKGILQKRIWVKC